MIKITIILIFIATSALRPSTSQALVVYHVFEVRGEQNILVFRVWGGSGGLGFGDVQFRGLALVKQHAHNSRSLFRMLYLQERHAVHSREACCTFKGGTHCILVVFSSPVRWVNGELGSPGELFTTCPKGPAPFLLVSLLMDTCENKQP